MSYQKNSWSDGDIITAGKLNNIENGVESVETNVTQATSDISTLQNRVTALEESSSTPADYQELVDDVSSLKADLTKKADPDGYYEDMTVGDAEQLVSTQYHEDATPYNYRTTGGSVDVGNREYVDEIVGGTIVWNQLAFKHNDYRIIQGDLAGISLTIDSEGLVSFSGILSSENYCDIQVLPAANNIPENHVYLMLCDNYDNNLTWSRTGFSPKNDAYYINKHNASFSGSARIRFLPNITYDVSRVRFSGFDLTQMFGSTIADYIYSLEQATKGAGVAYFRKLFPKDYYEYNAGELKSVSGLISHDMVGFNLWDEEYEVGSYNADGTPSVDATRIRTKNRIKVLPGINYYFKSPTTLGIRWYDADDKYISGTANANVINKSPINARYLRFSIVNRTVYNHDICINLSDPKRNGQYEPYHKRSYPLDSTLILRGNPKLDSNNNLYYDGDRYLPDGTVERRYGIVDLGTLSWNYNTSFSSFTSGAIARLIKSRNVLCELYPRNPADSTSSSILESGDKWISVNKGNNTSGSLATGVLIIKDSSYTDAAAFKAAMSGVMLVYELETPTTETADPYQEVQICDDWGTEEYVTDSTAAVLVPVGHKTRYPANLRDKLQHLPNLASADGYYMINQTGSQMTLEHFRIPKAPTTDGTYTLKATVSGGTPTYTWESES